MIVRYVFFASLMLLFPLLSRSQKTGFRNEFGFRSDNDAYLFYGQDRYYTNGLFINFRHAVNDEKLRKKTIKKIWEAEAGQYMYNAQSGSVADITGIDRPFAAWLYGGFKLNWYTGNEQVFQASLDAGTTGPNALGEDAQELLHSIVGFYEINGWQYQIGNGFGANAGFDYTRLLSRTSPNADFSLKAYVNAGTVFSGAGAGILFRAGDINQLFRSASTNSRISNGISDSIPNREFFFFTQPLLHFVAYNATLQGSLFSNDPSPVTRTPNRLAFSQELGFKYAADRWTFNFSLIFQTKETKSQVYAHQYGSIALYYRFN